MAKGPIMQDIWDSLPENRKERILARAAELEAEYLTLQELRQATGLTQARVSEALKIPQSNVSPLEKGSDMLLSTLRGYVESVRGKLKLTVELPNKPPITLTGLGDLIDNPKPEEAKPTR